MESRAAMNLMIVSDSHSHCDRRGSSMRSEPDCPITGTGLWDKRPVRIEGHMTARLSRFVSPRSYAAGLSTATAYDCDGKSRARTLSWERCVRLPVIYAYRPG